jgi:hypothetical protein
MSRGIANLQNYFKYNHMEDNIKGFVGYHVTKDGRIFSRRESGSGKLLENWKERKIQTDANNRKSITARDENGKVHLLRIHRLVLEAYVGPCPEGMEGCHNDGNASNNNLNNLRWDTPQNNANDKKNHGTIPNGEAHKNSKLNEVDVLCIFELRDLGLSYKEIGSQFNVDFSTIYKILKKKRWNWLSN